MSSFELHFSGGVLEYELWKFPIVESWSRMAEWYYGNDEYEREELAQNFYELDYGYESVKLKSLGFQLLEAHPARFDQKFLDTLRHGVYTRDDLNYLHGEYERIRTYDVPFALPEAFNDQIHVCERFHTEKGTIQSTIPPRPRVRTRFIHKEWGASAPWKMKYRPYDQEIFRQPVPGRLYMCYCEVGKPPYSAYRDRDVVQPVPWTQFGPAFYVTFQNWGMRSDDYDAARLWLEETHGPGLYWMGEPELGILLNMGVREAYEMVKQDPVIREMRWKYDR